MPLLQIDERKNEFAKVEIVWDNDSDETWIHVESVEYGMFDIPTTKALAHDVFMHPFAYRIPDIGWQQDDGYCVRAAAA